MSIDFEALHPILEFSHVDDDVRTLPVQVEVLDPEFAQKPVTLLIDPAGIILARDRPTVVDAIEDFVELQLQPSIVENAAVVKIGG